MREYAFEILDAINDPLADERERLFAAITLAEILDPDPLGDGPSLEEIDAADPEAAAQFDAECAAAAAQAESARAG